MQQLLVVEIRISQERRVGIGGDNLTGNQTVFAESLDRLEMTAFQVKVGFVDKTACDMLRGKGRVAAQDGFVALGLPG